VSSPELSRQLQEAIRLARAGKTTQAHVLLQQILAQAPDLAIAWLWLATVAATHDERVSALHRVLELEPDNQTARSALEQLGEALPPLPEQPASQAQAALEAALAPVKPDVPKEPFLTRRDLSVLSVVVALTLVMIVLAVLISEAQQDRTLTQNRPTGTFTPSPSFTPSLTFTPAPTRTPVVQSTLPPTWTAAPSPTPPLTRTPYPTWTPRPSRTPFPSFTPAQEGGSSRIWG
jgi:hypothetical protein